MQDEAKASKGSSAAFVAFCAQQDNNQHQEDPCLYGAPGFPPTLYSASICSGRGAGFPAHELHFTFTAAGPHGPQGIGPRINETNASLRFWEDLGGSTGSNRFGPRHILKNALLSHHTHRSPCPSTRHRKKLRIAPLMPFAGVALCVCLVADSMQLYVAGRNRGCGQDGQIILLEGRQIDFLRDPGFCANGG